MVKGRGRLRAPVTKKARARLTVPKPWSCERPSESSQIQKGVGADCGCLSPVARHPQSRCYLRTIRCPQQEDGALVLKEGEDLGRRSDPDPSRASAPRAAWIFLFYLSSRSNSSKTAVVLFSQEKPSRGRLAGQTESPSAEAGLEDTLMTISLVCCPLESSPPLAGRLT